MESLLADVEAPSVEENQSLIDFGSLKYVFSTGRTKKNKDGGISDCSRQKEFGELEKMVALKVAVEDEEEVQNEDEEV